MNGYRSKIEDAWRALIASMYSFTPAEQRPTVVQQMDAAVHAPEVVDASTNPAESENARLVGWISDFCAEHADWAEREFPQGCAEGDWLDDVYAVTGKVRA